MEAQAGAPGFQGCPYLAVQIELKDQGHAASRVAHRIKAKLTAVFRAEAEQGGASDPGLLALRLILVFDGATPARGSEPTPSRDSSLPQWSPCSTRQACARKAEWLTIRHESGAGGAR